MTLGMGSFARASSRAFCKPAARVAPGTTVSKNRASALPSGARLSRGSTAASRPRAASFLSRAGVAWPSAERATLTGMSLWDTGLSAAWAATCVTCTARRRGEANAVVRLSPVARPWALRVSARVAAKASPSFFRALGGSSSTNSSISRFFVVMVRLPSSRSGPALPRPRLWAPWGSPGGRGNPGSSGPRCGPGCGCGRCRRHARSRKWRPGRPAG